MPTPREEIMDLEQRFWQSMVDQDTDTALDILTEPALMVSSHGTMQFDHDGYRQMAEKGLMVLTGYELSEMRVMFPSESTAVVTYHAKQKLTPRGQNETIVQEVNDTSTWVKGRDGWKCVMHTETPADTDRASH